MTTKTPDKIAWDTMVAIDCLQKTSGQMTYIVPMIREADPGGPPLRIMTPAEYHQMRMHAENPLMNPPTQ